MEFFETIFGTQGVTATTFFLAIGIALALGIISAVILSFRLRSSKRFFIAMSLVPVVVAMVISLTSTAYSVGVRIVTIAVALGLIRFRSANGNAEEMIGLFLATAIGMACGLGYLAYAGIGAIALSLVYIGLTYLPIFTHKSQQEEKLLKITIPESLDYGDVFSATFEHYLKESELIGVKTTGMGSMFKLTYRIRMKSPKEEKEMIDELRTRNGNLEISVLPFVNDGKQL